MQQLYSVEQVANQLGLHVRTVRGYVSSGRLKAVRIGKQYRIARADLEAFTGRTAAGGAQESVRRTRHAEVSSIVQVDAISSEEMTRVANTLMAASAVRPDESAPLRIETVYHEERASLKIILLGGLSDTADLLRLVTTLVEDQ